MKFSLSKGLMMAVGALLLGFSARAADPGGVSVVVKIQDMERKTSYEVMSADEFKALDKTIQLENRCFQEAVQQAAKQWREDESNKGVPFAGSRLSPRRIVGSPERFTSREKADKQLNAYLEREQKQQDREADRNKTKKSGTRSKEQAAKDKDREASMSRAAELIKTRLDELVSSKAAASTAPTAPAAPAAGGAGAGAAKPDAAAKDAGKKAP